MDGGPCKLKLNHPIDRKVLVKVVDTLLGAIARNSYFKELVMFCIRSGTINAYDGGFVAASAKIDTDIEGLVPANDFVKLVKSSNGRFVDMNFSGDRLDLQFDDGMKISLNGSQNTEYHERFNLWDSSIQWHACPEELSNAIWQASYNASSSLLGIFASGDYVVAMEHSRDRACRYKLPSPVPFLIGLNAAAPILFDKLRNLRLLRVAKFQISYSTEDGVRHNDGYAFDYGDLRVWCCDAYYPHGYSDWEKVPIEINDRFSKGGMENLFVLPNGVKKIISKIRVITRLDKKAIMDIDESFTISIEEGKIIFSGATEGGTIHEELSIDTFRPLVPMTLITVPSYLAVAAKKGGLLGVKLDENNTPFAIYLKDDKLEHLIGLINPED
ncbi:hypothetical protein N9219_02380 [bacterium]|nr:hypothetical protein [bacterium]